MSDSSGSKPLFDRSELLRGLPARRATTLLFAIEARTARRVDASRSALATFQTERSASDSETAFLQAIAGARGLPVDISVQDLERYAASWADLVPPDPELRASLTRKLGEKYLLAGGRVPRLGAALGADEPAVAAAYARSWNEPVGASFPTAVPLSERLRWWRARVSERLETLPPVWMAFALALTETIAEGILAIPVAVAGVGPLAGIALLVILGLVNVVTLAALVEAITRTGQMRYGETYFGRLVREYLGLGASAVFTGTLFVFNVVVTLVYFLGFASVLGDATGVGLVWWVGLLFAINVVYVRRGSIDATVASALIIGAVNIALILAICAISLNHLDPANFTLGGADGSGDAGAVVLEVGLLQLVFGVILVAYFGHTSAGNAAKLILREDMTGRALLTGNVLAMVSVIGLYSLSVLAINGAVGADALDGVTGTALSPLADVAGPGVLVLGSIYVVLALGIGSIYGSLGLFNQVREWLPATAGSATGLAGNARRFAAERRGRTILSLLPIIAIFIVLEALIVAGAENFTGPLGIVGVLAVPLLGGVFPMLLIAAARRRGELVPRPVIWIVGQPVVVVAITGLFTLAVALHGLVIWQQPIERAVALGVTSTLILIAVGAVVRGRFRPRTVVQIRTAGSPGSVQASVVIAGRPAAAAAIAWTTSGDAGQARGAETQLGRASELRDLRIGLPVGTPRQIRVWSHQVDEENGSAAWPAQVTVTAEAGPTTTVMLDSRGIADVELTGQPSELRLAFGAPAGVRR